MHRRLFIKSTALGTAGILCQPLPFTQETILGHNNKRYRINTAWSKADVARYPVNDCHEMVQDSKGRILLLTNETKNNVLVYNKSGKLLDSWGHQFPGAHGLTIHHTGGDDFLFITDTVLHQVYKTTIDGRILLTINFPAETGLYAKKEEFVPTETTVLDNGEFYIADGYGLQYVMHFEANGKLKNVFGGK